MKRLTPRHSHLQYLRRESEPHKVWTKLKAEDLLLRWVKAELEPLGRTECSELSVSAVSLVLISLFSV
jgi:hypothetical protein